MEIYVCCIKTSTQKLEERLNIGVKYLTHELPWILIINEDHKNEHQLLTTDIHSFSFMHHFSKMVW